MDYLICPLGLVSPPDGTLDGDSRLSSDSYYGERLNDIGNCCRKRPNGMLRTGVQFPSAPPMGIRIKVVQKALNLLEVAQYHHPQPIFQMLPYANWINTDATNVLLSVRIRPGVPFQ